MSVIRQTGIGLTAALAFALVSAPVANAQHRVGGMSGAFHSSGVRGNWGGNWGHGGNWGGGNWGGGSNRVGGWNRGWSGGWGGRRSAGGWGRGRGWGGGWGGGWWGPAAFATGVAALATAPYWGGYDYGYDCGPGFVTYDAWGNAIMTNSCY